MSTRMQVILLSVIALMAVLGFTATGILLHDSKTVKQYQDEIEMLEQKVAMNGSDEGQEVDMQEHEEKEPEKEQDAKLPDLSQISEESITYLKEELPFDIQSIREVNELSQGLVVFRQLDSSERSRPTGGSIWIVNTNTSDFKLVATGDGGRCNDIRIDKILVDKGLFIVQKASSPCEAVFTIETLYFDTKGELVASLISGSYNHSPKVIDAMIEGIDLDIQLLSAGDCSEQKYSFDPSKAEVRPETTITGLRVNGTVHSFSGPVTTECQFLYGGGYGDPELPRMPEYDGENVIFHVTGHDVFIGQTGNVRYEPVTEYYIPCVYGSTSTAQGVFPAVQRLIREDEKGLHEIENNIFEGSLISELHDGRTCFETTSVAGNVIGFDVRSQEQFLGRTEGRLGTVEYNLSTNQFENLRLE